MEGISPAEGGWRARWSVGLQADPLGVHSFSMIAGLSMLAQSGDIELRLIRRALPLERWVWIEVEDRDRNEKKSICIDLGDLPEYTSPERSKLADSVWKRSYSGGPGRPLGLVGLMRSGTERWSSYLTSLARPPLGLDSFRIVRQSLSALRPKTRGNLLSSYQVSLPEQRRVFFQVTAWDPGDDGDQSRRALDRRDVNDRRARVITLLRRELGDRFVGGFIPSDYARRAYPNLVSPLPTLRREYVRLILENSICISTVGLYGSNPWKLAEYLAASRAIVSEPLCYRIPEPIEGTIATFEDEHSCLARCTALLDDNELLAASKARSADYFQRYVRPDQLILRRLFEEAGEDPDAASSRR